MAFCHLQEIFTEKYGKKIMDIAEKGGTSKYGKKIIDTTKKQGS